MATQLHISTRATAPGDRASARNVCARPARAVRALLVAGLVAGVVFPAKAAGPEPPESSKARNLAYDQARRGNWGEAMDAWADYVETLTTRHGRDTLLFGWVLDGYAKAAQAGRQTPDLDAFEAFVDARLESMKERPLIVWRLHLLKSDLARIRGDREARAATLTAAIQAYPKVFYPDPPTQSYLPTLYNESALLIAQEDLNVAKTTILAQFREDARWAYFDYRPWAARYQASESPDRFLSFLDDLLQAYVDKIANQAEIADSLIWYRLQLLQYHGRLVGQSLSR